MFLQVEWARVGPSLSGSLGWWLGLESFEGMTGQDVQDDALTCPRLVLSLAGGSAVPLDWSIYTWPLHVTQILEAWRCLKNDHSKGTVRPWPEISAASLLLCSIPLFYSILKEANISD